jgi:WbqC-like protein family
MQPAYLPWLGYFDRIAGSDLHIVLDHVEADLNSKTKFANRNKIRTKDGWTWLTVPLKTKGRRGSLYLNEIELDEESGWREKHWRTIKGCYGKAPHFAEHQAFFARIFEQPWVRLEPLTRALTGYFLDALGLKTPVRFSSEMGVAGQKSELILNLCREVGATTYISGVFGRDYLDLDSFRSAGIDVVFHEYAHPVYPQSQPGFEPYMSIVDLLVNAGPKSLAILAGTGMQGEAPLAEKA